MAKNRSKGSGTLFKRGGKGPWIASWYEDDGKRRTRTTRTTHRAAAERILRQRVTQAALRREGVRDPRQDRFAEEGRKPLSEHYAAYIAHCDHAGHAKRHVSQKREHLDRFAAGSGASRLTDLTADALEHHLANLRDAGLGARSINFARQIAIAFYSWCVRTQRAESNPLKVVPKLDESRDRRRVRRPLTDDELARLIAVGRERGREAWYLAAAFAGLRKGDLLRLSWADVDRENGAITVRGGKAKRIDQIPMHPQLADALRRRFEEQPATPTARVFPHEVTDQTRKRDFLHAGIAREVIVRDEAGEPVMVGKGKHERPKTRITTEDEEGRVVDLHALRTTLGTNLARAGVAPQLAQRIMRHADYRTTQQHYTVLGLTDTAGAIERLSPIGSPANEAQRATGTYNDAPDTAQRIRQQLERETAQSSASRCDQDGQGKWGSHQATTLINAPECDGVQSGAGKRATRVERATFSLEG